VAALVTARPPANHVAWVGDYRAVLARRRVLVAEEEEVEGGKAAQHPDARWSLKGATAAGGAAAGTTAPTAAATPPTSASVGWASAPAGLTAIELTLDHKPSTPAERARIEAAGGRVQRLVDPDTGAEVGPARVWLPTAWAPGLAMSRSLGDALARSVGVSSAADTTVAAIIATDGVWEFMSGQDAVEVVGSAASAAAGCAALVAEARRRWGVEEASGSVDDITAVVVSLDVSAGASGGGVSGGGLDRAGST
jgi:serine/threonine protein phosphatase PrpC